MHKFVGGDSSLVHDEGQGASFTDEGDVQEKTMETEANAVANSSSQTGKN